MKTARQLLNFRWKSTKTPKQASHFGKKGCPSRALEIRVREQGLDLQLDPIECASDAAEEVLNVVSPAV
jgi:hypothetical protein